MSEINSNVKTTSIKIVSKTGTEVDVTQIFLLINIYQSLLLKKFISGRIVLADTSDLISNLPLVGNEEVKITITNDYDTSYQDYTFRIYKIDRDFNTFKTNQKIKILNIYLYSDEEFNSFSRVSKRYQGTGSSIIQDVLTNNLSSTKTLIKDTDTSTIDFISNYWNSEQIIDHVLKKTELTYKDFIFFENNNGFNFKSLSTLFQQTPEVNLTFDISQEQFSNVDSILLYQFNNYFDDLNWLKKGLFGSTGHVLDNDLYKFEFKEETLQELDEQAYHSELNKMYCDKNDVSNRIYVSFYDDNEDVKNVRTTYLNLLNRYNFVVNLNGDINRNVGDLYKMEFPTLDNESVLGSDSFSGDWLVTEINTSLTQNNEMKQNISLSKNSLFKNIKLDRY
jgi:hypothetical protein